MCYVKKSQLHVLHGDRKESPLRYHGFIIHRQGTSLPAAAARKPQPDSYAYTDTGEHCALSLCCSLSIAHGQIVQSAGAVGLVEEFDGVNYIDVQAALARAHGDLHHAAWIAGRDDLRACGCDVSHLAL